VVREGFLINREYSVKGSIWAHKETDCRDRGFVEPVVAGSASVRGTESMHAIIMEIRRKFCQRRKAISQLLHARLVAVGQFGRFCCRKDRACLSSERQ